MRVDDFVRRLDEGSMESPLLATSREDGIVGAYFYLHKQLLVQISYSL